jgi:hypothetical protein
VQDADPTSASDGEVVVQPWGAAAGVKARTDRLNGSSGGWNNA